ncbi:MAG: DUF397 domain-containing protein [Kutzneria sp.]|nr:DUF397 domain-containing protein [Kutzneria sp.]
MTDDRFATAVFRKASGSGDAGCVEVAFSGDVVGVRDSKRRDSDVLCFTTHGWDVFLLGVRNNEFELPA